MAGRGTIIASAKSIVPKTTFFIVLPPLYVTDHISEGLARLYTLFSNFDALEHLHQIDLYH
jgi:hypothetical protein